MAEPLHLFRPSFIPEGTDSAGVRSILGSLSRKAIEEDGMAAYLPQDMAAVCRHRAAAYREMVRDASAYWQRKRKYEQEQHEAMLAAEKSQ